MTNFQLTENQKHYVNAAGDRCEAALLNGVWIAVWGNGNTTKHFEDGRSIRITRDYRPELDIAAAFEGWVKNPQSVIDRFKHHLPASENWQYASIFYEGEYDALAIQFHNEKPTEAPEDFMWAGGVWVYLSNSEIREFYSLPDEVSKITDEFDWRSSLTHRSEWE